MAIFDCHCDPVRRLSPLSLRTSPLSWCGNLCPLPRHCEPVTDVTGVAISDAEKRIIRYKKIPTAVCALPRNDEKEHHCEPVRFPGVAIFALSHVIANQ